MLFVAFCCSFWALGCVFICRSFLLLGHLRIKGDKGKRRVWQPPFAALEKMLIRTPFAASDLGTLDRYNVNAAICCAIGTTSNH